NEAVLHTDRSLLPRRRRAWASWNYHLSDGPAARTMVTYHMNRLQSLTAHRVFTREGMAAQRRVGEINGRNRTHFCGAYWGWGFHEDGVVSGLRVAERFGVRL